MLVSGRMKAIETISSELLGKVTGGAGKTKVRAGKARVREPEIDVVKWFNSPEECVSDAELNTGMKRTKPLIPAATDANLSNGKGTGVAVWDPDPHGVGPGRCNWRIWFDPR